MSSPCANYQPILASMEPDANVNLRFLTDREIDLISGGRGAFANSFGNGFASGFSSTFAQAFTKTFAIQAGPVSLAVGFGFAIAFGQGPEADPSVSVTVGATASV